MKKGERFYADTGSFLNGNGKRHFFETEDEAKEFVTQKSLKGERTGYRNEKQDKDTEWKVWWMKGDSTGKLQQQIFNNELMAKKFIHSKSKQGLLTGIYAQQKGMGLK